MRTYAVEKLCWRVVGEPELRTALEADPEPVLRAVRPPPSDEEIRAIIEGDVGRPSKMEVNHFLLHQLGRWKVRWLNLPATPS